MQLQEVIIIKSGLNVVVRRYGIGESGREAQESGNTCILMADSLFFFNFKNAVYFTCES